MEIPCSQESQETIIQAFGQAVELEYSIQNSLQTPPKCSNMQKLVSMLKRFLNITVVGKSQQKIFVEDLLKYVELIMIFLSSDMEYRKQRKYESQYMSFIPDIFKTIDLKNVFVQHATVKTLELIMYGDYSFVSKRSWLTTYNEIVSHSEKQVRNEVAKETVNIMYNLLDCLETHGDFVLQSDILETLFRIFGTQIKNNSFELLPGSQELGKALLDISMQDFDGDARRWLNKFNQDSPYIFSIACKMVMFGNDVCPPPKEQPVMWMDFNLKESMLGFYSDSLTPSSWNRLIILAKDVKKVEVKRVLGASETTVSIDMTRPCISEIGSFQKQYDKLEKHLKLVIGNEDKEKVARLMTIVLPQMFGDTFSRLSSRISTKLKNVYKPLTIKVSRPKSGSSEASIGTTSSRSIMKSDVSTDEVMLPKVSCLSPGSIDDENSVKTSTDGGFVPVTEKLSKGYMRISADEEVISVKTSTDGGLVPVSEKLSKGYMRISADEDGNRVKTSTDGGFVPVTKKISNGHMRLSADEDITLISVTDFTRLSCPSPTLDVMSNITSDNLDILPSSKPASLIRSDDSNCSRKTGKPKLQDNIITSSHGDDEAASSTHAKIEILSGRCSGRSADYQRLVREDSGFNPSELFSSSPIKFSSPQEHVKDVSSEFSASEDREICNIMSDFLTDDIDPNNGQNAKNTVELQEVLGEISDSQAIFTTSTQLYLPHANQNTEEYSNNFSLAVNVGISENQLSDCPYTETTILKHNINVPENHDAPNMEVESVKKDTDVNVQLLEGGKSKRSKIILEANKENIIDLTIDGDDQETNGIEKIINSNANKDNFEIVLPNKKYMWNTPQLLDCLEGVIPLQETAQQNTQTTDGTITHKDGKVNVSNKAEIGKKPKTKKKKPRTLIKTGKKRFDLEEATEQQNFQDHKFTNKNELKERKRRNSTERKGNANLSKELHTASCPEVRFKKSTTQETDGLQSLEQTKENVQQICEKNTEHEKEIFKKAKQYGEFYEKTEENDKQIFEKTDKYGEQNCETSKQNVEQIFEKAKENQAVSEEDLREVFQKEPIQQCIKQLTVVLTNINIEEKYENSSSGLGAQLAPEINSENLDCFEAFDEPNKSERKNRLANAIQENVEAAASASSVMQTAENIVQNNTFSHASEADMARKITTEHVDNSKISIDLEESDDDIVLSQFILKKGARPLPGTQEEVSDHHEKDIKINKVIRKSNKGKGRKQAKLRTPEVKKSNNNRQPEYIETRDIDMDVLPVGKRVVITPDSNPEVGQKLGITCDTSPEVGPEVVTTIAQVHWFSQEVDNEAMGSNRTTRSKRDLSLSQEFKALEELCVPKTNRKRKTTNLDEIVTLSSPVLKKTRSSERLKINQSPEDFENLCQTAFNKSKMSKTISGNRSRKLFTPSNLSYLDDLPAITEQKTPESETPIPITTVKKQKRTKRSPKENRKSAEKRKTTVEQSSRQIKKSPKEKSAKNVSKPRNTRTKGGNRKQFEFSTTNFKTLDEMFNRTALSLENNTVRQGFDKWNNPPMDIAVRAVPQWSSSDDSPLARQSARNKKNDSPKLPKTLIDVSQTPPTPNYNSSDLEIEPYHKKADVPVAQKKINIQQHIIIPPKKPLQNLTSNEDFKIPMLHVESIPPPNVPLTEPAVLDHQAETCLKVCKLMQYLMSLHASKSPESVQKIDALFKHIFGCD